MDSYLGCLTSGAPDLEGKNRKKKKGRKKEVIKGTGRKEALSQRWTAVCDRHPGAEKDVRVQIKPKGRKPKTNKHFLSGVWKAEEKSI